MALILAFFKLIEMSSDKDSQNKKKLSGAEYKKRKLEREAKALKNAQNITSFFAKGRCECENSFVNLK